MNYDDVRKVVQDSGIPICIVGTGNMFSSYVRTVLPATDRVDAFTGTNVVPKWRRTVGRPSPRNPRRRLFPDDIRN
ncbi:MAG: hypothetical protein IPK58_24165 [Acidobacteria bacterium]|nr:hypothetical protein [Acidobacteriota bacterium]